MILELTCNHKNTIPPHRSQELFEIMEIALQNINDATPRLLYEVLHKLDFDCPNLNSIIYEQLITLLADQLTKTTVNRVAQILYGILVLGNLTTVSSSIIHAAISDSERFINVFTELLAFEDIIHIETLWCLGNMLKMSQETGIETDFLEAIVQCLLIPRKPQYMFKQYAAKNTAGEIGNDSKN